MSSVGLGASFVVMGAAATTGVPPQEAGMTSGLINSSRQLGGSIGQAGLSAVAAATASDTSVEALSDGYSTALLLGGALIAAGALIGGGMVPRARPATAPGRTSDRAATSDPD